MRMLMSRKNNGSVACSRKSEAGVLLLECMIALSLLLIVAGGLMGGLAGVLVAPLINIHYEMGLLLTLKGFAAAILGGLTSPLGAVFGGVTLGLVESLAVVAVSSGYKDVIAMAILILIMIVMPQGLLGRRGRRGG